MFTSIIKIFKIIHIYHSFILDREGLDLTLSIWHPHSGDIFWYIPAWRAILPNTVPRDSICRYTPRRRSCTSTLKLKCHRRMEVYFFVWDKNIKIWTIRPVLHWLHNRAIPCSGENKQDSIGKLVTQIFQQVNFLKGLLPSALFHLTKRKLRDFTDFQELFSKHCVNSPQTLKKGTVNNE